MLCSWMVVHFADYSIARSSMVGYPLPVGSSGAIYTRGTFNIVVRRKADAACLK